MYKKFCVEKLKQKSVHYASYTIAKHPTVIYCVIIELEINKQFYTH